MAVTVLATGALAWASGLIPAKVTRVRGGEISTSLTIAPTTLPGTRAVFPGGHGDAALAITNPGTTAIMMTGVRFSVADDAAAGYRDRDNRVSMPGCTTANSTVGWRTGGAPAARLARPLIIGAGQTVDVVLTGAVGMSANAPTACMGAYFALPALAGVVAHPVPGATGVSPVIEHLIG